MAKVIHYTLESNCAGQDVHGEMEVPDDATDDDINEMVRDEFFNHFNYGWSFKEKEPRP